VEVVRSDDPHSMKQIHEQDDVDDPLHVAIEIYLSPPWHFVQWGGSEFSTTVRTAGPGVVEQRDQLPSDGWQDRLRRWSCWFGLAFSPAP
jgi:hypothetical protein